MLRLLLAVTLTAALLASALAIETPYTMSRVKRQDLPTATSALSPSSSTAITFTTTNLIVIAGETNSVVTIPAKTITITIPTCIQTIEPDENGHVPPGTCGALWNYYPTFGAAIAFTGLFAVLVIVHIWMAAKYKKRWCWVIIMASIWETTAMLFRAVSSKNQQASGIYLVFQIFILLAPLWVNAFAYMTLARMVYFFHPSRMIFRMPAAIISAVFVFFDLAAFVIQLIGGSMAGPGDSPEDQRRAVNIYMAGIGFQQLVIVFFVGLCIVFQFQMAKLETHPGNSSTYRVRTKWFPLLCALYIALSMITVRIVYRLVEFSGGINQGNALTAKEIYFYVLEAAPMLIALSSFALFHPARFMNGPGSDMPGPFTLLKNKLRRWKGKQEILDDGQESDTHELMSKGDLR